MNESSKTTQAADAARASEKKRSDEVDDGYIAVLDYEEYLIHWVIYKIKQFMGARKWR